MEKLSELRGAVVPLDHELERRADSLQARVSALDEKLDRRAVAQGETAVTTSCSEVPPFSETTVV